jgi:hypothetical protein
MKKSVLLAAGVCLLSGMTAFADPVTSVNGVGIERFTVAGDRSALIRIDFEKIGGGSWNVYDLFGTNFAHAVTVFYWTPSGWAGENFDPVFVEWDPGTTPFYRGDSLFVRMRGTADITNTITIAGEIPGANNGATNTVLGVDSGLNTLGYAYPAPIAITNTTLNVVAGTNQMTVFYWISASSAWGGVNYDPVFQEWDPQEFTLQPGQGYMIRKYGAGTQSWSETKPYNWP